MADWVPWNDYYEVGILTIDDQHRELFRQFNQVCDAVWDGKGRDSVRAFLFFLANYAQEHFGNEEKYMQKHAYPAYVAHKSAHDKLVGEVTAFLEKYDAEDLESGAVVKVITDLGAWTRKHIRAMDQELGKFLKRME
jgi:hemerythrin